MRNLGLLLLLCCGLTNAQNNPFEDYDYDPQIGTLSGGEYVEDFDNDSIVRIGSITLNVKQNTVTGIVIESLTFTEGGVEPSIMSRWFQPDPMAEEFAEDSPYVFVKNNPMKYVDPTGAFPVQAKDWFQNKSGDITYYNSKDQTLSKDGEELTNVGENLTEVAETLKLSGSTTEFSDTSVILLGARGRSAGFLGLPAPVTLDIATKTDISFGLTNAGENGLDRIDGKTQISSVNIKTDISVTTSAPGVELKALGGTTSFAPKYGPTGYSDTYSSQISTTNQPMLSSSFESSITGSSTISLSLNNVYRRTRGFSSSFSPKVNVNGVVPIYLGQNGKSKVLNFSSQKLLKKK